MVVQTGGTCKTFLVYNQGVFCIEALHNASNNNIDM